MLTFFLPLLACGTPTPPVAPTPTVAVAPAPTPKVATPTLATATEAAGKLRPETAHVKSLAGFEQVLKTRWGFATKPGSFDVSGERAAALTSWLHLFQWQPLWRIEGAIDSAPGLGTDPEQSVELYPIRQILSSGSGRPLTMVAWKVDGDQASVQLDDGTTWTLVREPGWARVAHQFTAPDTTFDWWFNGGELPPKVKLPTR